jgi:hypothetical protein
MASVAGEPLLYSYITVTLPLHIINCSSCSSCSLHCNTAADCGSRFNRSVKFNSSLVQPITIALAA